jgi:hypothetical protein
MARLGKRERLKARKRHAERAVIVAANLATPRPAQPLYGAPQGYRSTSADYHERLQGNAHTPGFHGPMGGISLGGTHHAKRTGRGGNKLQRLPGAQKLWSQAVAFEAELPKPREDAAGAIGSSIPRADTTTTRKRKRRVKK